MRWGHDVFFINSSSCFNIFPGHVLSILAMHEFWDEQGIYNILLWYVRRLFLFLNHKNPGIQMVEEEILLK